MKIHFFSASFPFGNGETFVENEVPVLSRNIAQMTIYPLNSKGDQRAIPSNVSVFISNKAPRLRLKDFITILKVLMMEFRFCNNRLFYLKKARRHGALLKKAIKLGYTILENPDIQPKDVFYSYWMNDWALALALLKMNGKIDQFVFRCGGFDIWDERNEGNYLPFRGFIYKYSSGIFPNSITAEKYLKKKRLFPEKIVAQYWGTADHGVGFRSENDQLFQLVSCANVIPLKRVHLIAEALKYIDQPVHWVHFGDGSEMEQLARIVQSNDLSHHQISLKGRVSNQAIYQHYQTQPVDLFISMSSTEGLPVSMQEAISFGIPIFSTNVGGIHEIVQAKIGVLVDPDITCKDAAAILEKIIKKDESYQFNSSEIRQFWKDNFAAATCYSNYASLLTDIFQQ
jgi:glycosyltransferase involved in cell wall biosynthesis